MRFSYVIIASVAALLAFGTTMQVTAEPAVRLVVADAVCAALEQTGGRSDVDYQPGIDVHGNPVARADLEPAPLRVPMPVMLDVSVDVAQRLGLSPDLEALLNVAQVSERNGQILINGRPAGDLGRDMARAACLRGQ